MIFADGCAASLISAEPVGFEILGFTAAVIPGSEEEITWRVGDRGFDMRLSGAVPGLVGRGMPRVMDALYTRWRPDDPSPWAVHPGGRSVLDAVEQSLSLPPPALAAPRAVLRRYGTISTASALFSLGALMQTARPPQPTAAAARGGK